MGVVHLQVGDFVSESFDALLLLCDHQLVLLQRLLEIFVSGRCVQKLSRSFRRCGGVWGVVQVNIKSGAALVYRTCNILRVRYVDSKINGN